MGTYINIGNAGFQRARNSEYVDKSGLISVVNRTLFTERQFSCVSRCRRFGKSMAAKMLYAYYDHSCDSRLLNDDIRVLRPTGASVGQAASGYAVLHNGKAANNIVIGETYRGEAAVDAIENETQTTGQHYTLDGRRVEGVPSRKGVYIINGKKTVIM